MNNVLNWLRENKWIIFIFLLGAAVRLLLCGVVPPGLNQDEASIGYDAYAVLNYGIDRNGVHNPVHFIAWGSGQNALYGYLSMPFIYLFGLTPLSIRGVSILFGIIGLLVFYFLIRRIHAHKQMAILGMFLLMISPWHIMMSRWALESNLFPTMVLIAVLLLYKSIEKNNWFPVACFIFALSLYAYGTSYFFIPIFLFLSVLYLIIYKKIKWKQLIIGVVIFVVTAIPIFLFVIINRLKLHSIDLGLFTVPKLTGTPRFDQVSSVFSDNLIQSAFQNFSKFLTMFIKQDDGLIWNSLPPYGFLYVFCIPLLLIGLIKSIINLKSKKWSPSFIMLAWFITSVVMAFITDVNINRINIIFIPSIYFVSYGVWILKERFSVTYIPIFVAFTLCFISFTNDYFVKFPQKVSHAFYESFGDALQYAFDATDGKIAITDQVNMPYIYTLFYEKTDPKVFRDTVQYINPDGPFQFVSSFGRYIFGNYEVYDKEIAAYVIPNSDISQFQSNEFEITPFKLYSVAVRKVGFTSIEPTETISQVSLKNKGFESGNEGWSFIGRAGIGSNRPMSGSYLAYLDPGNENQVSQRVSVDAAGKYIASAYVSAGGSGGKFGVKVNDIIISESDIPSEFDYVQLSHELTVEANDIIEIYIIGGDSWVNVDDFDFLLPKE